MLLLFYIIHFISILHQLRAPHSKHHLSVVVEPLPGKRMCSFWTLAWEPFRYATKFVVVGDILKSENSHPMSHHAPSVVYIQDIMIWQVMAARGLDYDGFKIKIQIVVSLHLQYLLLASVRFNASSSPTAWLTWTPPFSRTSAGGVMSVLRRVAASDLLCILIATPSVLEYHNSSCRGIVIVAEAERIGNTVGLEAKRTVGVGLRLVAVGKSTMSWSRGCLGASADMMMILFARVEDFCNEWLGTNNIYNPVWEGRRM